MNYTENREKSSEPILTYEEHKQRILMTRRVIFSLKSEGDWTWLDENDFVLFGSTARGEARPSSDVDVAVKVDMVFADQTAFNYFDYSLRTSLRPCVLMAATGFEIHTTIVSSIWFDHPNLCFLMPGVIKGIREDGKPLFD